MVKNLPASTGDTRALGSIPGWERSPGGGNGNVLQYSCLENSMGTHTHTHTCWETWVTLSFPSSSSVMSPLLFLALHGTPSNGQLLVFWLKKKKKKKMAAKPSSIQELLLQVLTLKQFSQIRHLLPSIRRRSLNWLRVQFPPLFPSWSWVPQPVQIPHNNHILDCFFPGMALVFSSFHWLDSIIPSGFWMDKNKS